jgi:hypothetical protein
VTLAAEPSLAPRPTIASSGGLIEIELASGARLRISATADAATVTAVIMALTGRRR